MLRTKLQCGKQKRDKDEKSDIKVERGGRAESKGRHDQPGVHPGGATLPRCQITDELCDEPIIEVCDDCNRLGCRFHLYVFHWTQCMECNERHAQQVLFEEFDVITCKSTNVQKPMDVPLTHEELEAAGNRQHNIHDINDIPISLSTSCDNTFS